MIKTVLFLSAIGLIQAAQINAVEPQDASVEDSCEYLDNGCPADFNIHLLLPHETSCRQFYYCANGEKILSKCNRGLVFNPEIQNCDHPGSINRTCEDEDSSSEEEATTVGTQSSEEIEHHPNGCPVDWGISTYLPHENYCNLYYQCNFGVLIERRCGPGTHFDPETQNCNFISAVGCTLPGGDASSEEQEETSEEPITTVKPPMELLDNGCPVNGSIDWLVPHEDDCSKFYFCVWGSKIVSQCPSNLHFSPALQRCESPAVAGCICQDKNCSNECTGDDCDNDVSECTGNDCNNDVSGCTGDDCDNDVSECTGNDCDNNVSECTGNDCDNNVSGCTGDDCDNNVSGCTGNDCDNDVSGCTGDDCDNNISECTGDDCDNNVSGCTGDDCDNNVSECTGNDCDNDVSGCTGDDCDNNVSVCTGDDCDNDVSECTGNDCNNDVSECTGNDCDNNVSGCTGNDCDTASAEDLPGSDDVEEPECEESKEEPENNKCEEECNVLPWAHDDCDKYWSCDGKNAVLVVCSEGLHFNPSTYTCDFACNAGCVKENVQTTAGSDGVRIFLPWNKIDNRARDLLKLIAH